MPTLEEVRQQIKHIDPLSKLLGRKEIRALPKVLWEDETIDGLIQGWYKGKSGVLVATNRRLIFVDKGWFFGMTVEDFAYDKVTSVQYEEGIFLGKVTIMASGNQAVIEKVNNAAARAFANRIRVKMMPVPEAQQPNGGNGRSSSKPDEGEDVVSKLERLARLKEQGALTEEEFQQGKRKLLEF